MVVYMNTPQFIKVNRSEYGKDTEFDNDIAELTGNKCYIPTSGNGFKKCNKYLTGRDYTGEFLIFIRDQ